MPLASSSHPPGLSAKTRTDRAVHSDAHKTSGAQRSPDALHPLEKRRVSTVAPTGDPALRSVRPFSDFMVGCPDFASAQGRKRLVFWMKRFPGGTYPPSITRFPGGNGTRVERVAPDA